MPSIPAPPNSRPPELTADKRVPPPPEYAPDVPSLKSHLTDRADAINNIISTLREKVDHTMGGLILLADRELVRLQRDFDRHRIHTFDISSEYDNPAESLGEHGDEECTLVI